MPRNIALRAPQAIVVALLFVLCLAAGSRGAAAQDAASFIQNLGNQAIQVLSPSVPPAQRTAHFRRLFEADFDLPGAARFVLGPNARALTPEQNQEFLTLFREYLAQAYSKRLTEYGGEPFHVTGSRPNGEETIVASQVQRRGGTPIEIDWHVIDRDGRMQIAVVYVDGVSMKVTHRQEFASIIQRNGGRADALLPALRQELGQAQVGRSGPSPQPMPEPAARSGASYEPLPAPQAPAPSGSSSGPMPAPQPPAPAER
jgi:phospholipid transport system substrate-binding protein